MHTEGEGSMDAPIVPAALHSRIGAGAAEGLTHMFQQSHQMPGARFERRLTEEVCSLRVEMHQGFAALRTEMATTRIELLKWSFLFWVGQLGAVAALLSYMLPGR